MIFKYHVKHNGIVYLPGTNVPIDDNKVNEKMPETAKGEPLKPKAPNKKTKK